EDDAVVEVGAQHRRGDVPYVRVPPGQQVLGGGIAEQPGDGRAAAAVRVGDGGGEQWRPRADVAYAVADDDAEALMPPPGAGRDGPVARLAEQPGRQTVEDWPQCAGQCDRAGQLVPGVLAHTVGDTHVEAELEERVGYVDRAHRGGRHRLRPVR